MRKVSSDETVLMGHSLGSSAAHEAVCAHLDRRQVLVTLGSPLGVRNPVFDHLRPVPYAAGGFPIEAAVWTNVSDTGDVQALAMRLAPSSGNRVQDLTVNNGSSAHDVSPCLTVAQTGHVIAGGLARRAS